MGVDAEGGLMRGVRRGVRRDLSEEEAEDEEGLWSQSEADVAGVVAVVKVPL